MTSAGSGIGGAAAIPVEARVCPWYDPLTHSLFFEKMIKYCVTDESLYFLPNTFFYEGEKR